jgi:transcriptional regulator with XRE-family HTH domain
MPEQQPQPKRAPRPPVAIARALRGISEDLVVWRKLRGLTQAQLADRAGIARTTLVRLERGDGGVSFENVLRVVRALGLLDAIPRALDPYETDVGRLRADEQLPRRVRPKTISESGDG